MWGLGGITDSMDESLSTLQEMGKDREAWHAAVHRVAKSWTWLNNNNALAHLALPTTSNSLNKSLPFFWSPSNFGAILDSLLFFQSDQPILIQQLVPLQRLPPHAISSVQHLTLGLISNALLVPLLSLLELIVHSCQTKHPYKIIVILLAPCSRSYSDSLPSVTWSMNSSPLPLCCAVLSRSVTSDSLWPHGL